MKIAKVVSDGTSMGTWAYDENGDLILIENWVAFDYHVDAQTQTGSASFKLVDVELEFTGKLDLDGTEALEAATA